MEAIMNTPRLITEKELSQITGRALSTLRNDRHRARGIPYLKLGRSVRYNLEDVYKYLKSKKIETEST